MVAMMGWGAAEQGWRKGPWTPEEDKLLSEYVNLNGEGRWSSVARCAGLKRNGKSCRLRWVNYLRPGLKRGPITPQEEGIIIELHALWGNKWSTIARYLPGRTDNEIKNFWRTHFKKKAQKSTHHQIQQEKRKAAQIQQLAEKDEENMNMIRSPTVALHVEASSNKLGEMTHHHDETEARQDENMVVTLEEDRVQCCFPVLNNQYHGIESWSDIIGNGDEDGLWGCLWNLDDDDRHLQGRTCMDHTISHYCNNRIIGMHNEARPLSSNNDDFYNGNGGHIF